MISLGLAVLAVIIAISALLEALRANRRARAAYLQADAAMGLAKGAHSKADEAWNHAHATRCQAGPPPTPEQRIAALRGVIQACKAMELTLGEAQELPALLMLASQRSQAAQARETLRGMGIEV